MPDPLPIFRAAEENRARTALIDASGRLAYGELLAASAAGASALHARGLFTHAKEGARIALLAPGGRDYVIAQWAIWRAGAACVPLCIVHPEPELAHVLDDADVSGVIAHPSLAPRVERLAAARGLPLVLTSELAQQGAAYDAPVELQNPALILYTSGTTGKPKGVVTTHAILSAQMRAVVDGWEMTPRDHIVHVLPLHHLHGILNALCAPLLAGGTCELLPRFDAAEVARAITRSSTLTLFMGVPTMYARLAQHWEASGPDERAALSAGFRRLRLMVSGSAALPVAMMERFATISGHTLLERYGMTELGMVLGNPLHGARRAGFVGVPFPGVDVRVVDEHGASVADGEPGEIQVRGASVFREYFRKPEATARAFTADGYFRTGDIAVRDGAMHRILGRESVDILKTGGFKVSALEIEDALREHEAILDCAVVGVPDDEWGQRIAVAVELRADHTLELEGLRAWAKERLAPYKVPTRMAVVASLPRNALGKVQKPDVTRAFVVGAARQD